MSEKLTEAKEDFEKCISLNDSFIPAKIQLAYSIYKSAALQQALILAQGAVEMLQKTVEKYPDSADAHSLFAQVSLRLFSGIKFILHSAQNVLLVKMHQTNYRGGQYWDCCGKGRKLIAQSDQYSGN